MLRYENYIHIGCLLLSLLSFFVVNQDRHILSKPEWGFIYMFEADHSRKEAGW